MNKKSVMKYEKKELILPSKVREDFVGPDSLYIYN